MVLTSSSSSVTERQRHTPRQLEPWHWHNDMRNTNNTRHPTIRLVSATPSATGQSTSDSLPSASSPSSTDANTSHFNSDSPWAIPSPPNTSSPQQQQHRANWSADSSWAIPSPPPTQIPIAPKQQQHHHKLLPRSQPDQQQHQQPLPARKRVVPKKSKLGLLAAVGRDNKRAVDFSDVVRRVGRDAHFGVGAGVEGEQEGGQEGGGGEGGFEIYVDATDDPELDEEMLVVRKKKSRAGLDAVGWGGDGGSYSGDDKTSVLVVGGKSKGKGKENDRERDEKDREKEKWWSIGRGRKDSKEKVKQSLRDERKPPLPPIPNPPLIFFHSPFYRHTNPHRPRGTRALQLPRLGRPPLLLQYQHQHTLQPKHPHAQLPELPELHIYTHTHIHALTHPHTHINTHARLPFLPLLVF